ncbi:MAG: hypothetical protein K0S32_459 [Bacteroidetes bacterium]|jgi:hypothetical protein|nr:hypothetical protein [Bacteroidota bacterium]
MSVKLILKTIVAALFIFQASSCEKPAGPGGKATVKGKVYAYDFDNTQRYLLWKGYSSDEKVFICYGNSTSIGNDVNTSADGSFEFRYLNKGHYKVFVNSLDTSIKVKGNDTELPVIKEFDITDASQTINLDDIIINK